MIVEVLASRAIQFNIPLPNTHIDTHSTHKLTHFLWPKMINININVKYGLQKYFYVFYFYSLGCFWFISFGDIYAVKENTKKCNCTKQQLF